MNITVLTDHKPLINIFRPNHKSPSPKMTKWLLRLQPYKVTVDYYPGNQNASDILSRPPNKEDQNDCLSNEAEQYISYVGDNSVLKATTLEEIENESSKDELVQKIRQYLPEDKWPVCYKTFNTVLQSTK